MSLMPAEPMLMFDVAVGPPREVGVIAGQQRRFIPITGGSVSGRFSAEILPGGDWQDVEPDGTLQIDAHYILQTETGLVEVRSTGLRAGPPEVLAKLMRGETAPASEYYFRTFMRFKTAVADLAWLNHRLVDISSTGPRAEAVFEHRGATPKISADVVIAADGIHSAVRRKLYPNEGLPKWNGVTLWRSTTTTRTPATRSAMLWAGHSRQKFVCYPIAHDAVMGETQLNWICDLRSDDNTMLNREDWNRRGDCADFLPPFATWRWPGIDVAEIVNASSEIFEFPMIDRDPLPRWTQGRVTLLGDVAHPMYPIGSNGATQAIIDARALAFHLATAPNADIALARYEEARRPATARIVLGNRANGPDQVMELAEQRAPNAVDNLDAALPMSERREIADSYKRVAGFDPATLNARESFTPPVTR